MKADMMQSRDSGRLSGTVAYIAVMTALSAVFGYVEQLIPVNIFGIPGVKLGLANVVSLIALYLFGAGYAFLILIVRILIVGFMFGNMYSIFFSLTGGVLSMTVMLLLKKTKLLTMTGVSAAGGTAHNMGQLLVAAVTMNEINLTFYIPVLAAAGVVAGCLMGIVGRMIVIRLDNTGKDPGVKYDRIS